MTLTAEMYNCLYCYIVVSILSKCIYFPIGWTWGSSRQAGGGRRLFGKQRVVGNIRNIERKFSRHTDWTLLVINLIHLVSADWFLCVSTDRPGTTVCRSDELLNWRWMCEWWSDSTEWMIILRVPHPETWGLSSALNRLLRGTFGFLCELFNSPIFNNCVIRQ